MKKSLLIITLYMVLPIILFSSCDETSDIKEPLMPFNEVIDRYPQYEMYDAHYYDQNNALWLLYSSGISETYVLKKTDGKFIETFRVKGLAYSLHMLDEKKGYMIVSQDLYSTSDGGKNWILIDDITGIIKINVVEENIIYAFSGPRKLYKSIDGGKNWILLLEDFTESITEIFFINESIGFIGFHDGSEILKTNNGGVTWSNISFPINGRLNDFYFVDDEIGFATSFHDDRLVGTMDGGESWEIISEGDFYGLRHVYFYKDGRGFITTKGYNVWYSDDFGRTLKPFINNNGSADYPDGPIIPINENELVIVLNTIQKVSFQ